MYFICMMYVETHRLHHTPYTRSIQWIAFTTVRNHSSTNTVDKYLIRRFYGAFLDLCFIVLIDTVRTWVCHRCRTYGSLCFTSDFKWASHTAHSANHIISYTISMSMRNARVTQWNWYRLRVSCEYLTMIRVACCFYRFVNISSFLYSFFQI